MKNHFFLYAFKIFLLMFAFNSLIMCPGMSVFVFILLEVHWALWIYQFLFLKKSETWEISGPCFNKFCFFPFPLSSCSHPEVLVVRCDPTYLWGSAHFSFFPGCVLKVTDFLNAILNLLLSSSYKVLFSLLYSWTSEFP
jgi:hypothetical protein